MGQMNSHRSLGQRGQSGDEWRYRCHAGTWGFVAVTRM